MGSPRIAEPLLIWFTPSSELNVNWREFAEVCENQKHALSSKTPFQLDLIQTLTLFHLLDF